MPETRITQSWLHPCEQRANILILSLQGSEEPLFPCVMIPIIHNVATQQAYVTVTLLGQAALSKLPLTQCMECLWSHRDRNTCGKLIQELTPHDGSYL